MCDGENFIGKSLNEPFQMISDEIIEYASKSFHDTDEKKNKWDLLNKIENIPNSTNSFQISIENWMILTEFPLAPKEK